MSPAPEPLPDLKTLPKKQLRKLVRKLHAQATSQAWEMRWMTEHEGVMPTEQDFWEAIWLPVKNLMSEAVGAAIDRDLGDV